MERFTDQIDSILFREKAENILSRPKPFWNFKNLIEQSEFRQVWFDFRLNENMEWLKCNSIKANSQCPTTGMTNSSTNLRNENETIYKPNN